MIMDDDYDDDNNDDDDDDDDAAYGTDDIQVIEEQTLDLAIGGSP